MRIKLAFAAITLCALSIVSCQPDAPSSPELDYCTMASAQSERNRDWIIQAREDGASGRQLSAYCHSLIEE